MHLKEATNLVLRQELDANVGVALKTHGNARTYKFAEKGKEKLLSPTSYCNAPCTCRPTAILLLDRVGG